MNFMTRSRSSPCRAKPSPARLALTTLLLLGSFAAAASAQGYHQGGRYDNRGNDHRDMHRHWNDNYYQPPPVVYGTPYYPPPPVVYGPGIGFVMPGVVIGVQ